MKVDADLFSGNGGYGKKEVMLEGVRLSLDI